MARLRKRSKCMSFGKPKRGKRRQPRGNSSVIGKWDPRRTPRENYNELGIIGCADKIAENVAKAGGNDNGKVFFYEVPFVVVVADFS